MTNKAQIEAVKAAAEKVFGLTDLVEEDEWTLSAGLLEKFGLACFEAALSAAPQGTPKLWLYDLYIDDNPVHRDEVAHIDPTEYISLEGYEIRNVRPLYAAPAAPALGDLPSRLMGWAGKARRDGNKTIELNLETVDRIIEFCSAPAAPVVDEELRREVCDILGVLGAGLPWNVDAQREFLTSLLARKAFAKAGEHLGASGSYAAFDEPHSVKTARAALNHKETDSGCN